MMTWATSSWRTTRLLRTSQPRWSARGVPVHLTSLANEPLKKYFKPAIESLIHRHLNPGIKSDNDALCTLAWKKLDKEPLSLANSKFISASWKSGFLAALVGCPRLECVELHAGDPMRYEACHACGRKKHPATWKLEFYGQPYDQDTLEPTDEDQSSDSNDDDGEDPQLNHRTARSAHQSVGMWA